VPRFTQIFPRLPELQEAIDKKQVEEQIAPFLAKMSEMESSGGKNVDHKRMVAGIHAGDVAQGQWGLMPNTIKELTYTKGDERDPKIEQLRGMPLDVITEEAKQNPELERKYAEALARKILTNSMGDEELAAVGWRYGHNLNEGKLQNIAKKKRGYLNRFKKLFELEPKKEIIAEDQSITLPES
jgi:hypothetical protein